MNEYSTGQPQFDFRTGGTTFVHAGVMSQSDQQACARLNRQRASAIKATARDDASRESLPLDVWVDSFARKVSTLEVRLIRLQDLGFLEDGVEGMSSKYLGNIGLGREASAWADRTYGCVYKFFDLKLDSENRASMGLKLQIKDRPPNDVEVFQEAAVLEDILDKICILHEAGACPTEIIGLSEDGKYLIVKQPRCKAYDDFHKDREQALKAIKGVAPKGSFGNELWIIHADQKAWLLSDLHKGNIRRLPDGSATIIDALVGELPDYYLKHHPKLREAAEKAKVWTLGNAPPSDDPFQSIADDEL